MQKKSAQGLRNVRNTNLGLLLLFGKKCWPDVTCLNEPILRMYVKDVRIKALENKCFIWNLPFPVHHNFCLDDVGVNAINVDCNMRISNTTGKLARTIHKFQIISRVKEESANVVP